jgi:ligand-binding sensor domain-containing protein
MITNWKQAMLIALWMLSPVVALAQSGEWASYSGKEMIARILDDGDYLWVATNSGLLKLNTETEETALYNRDNAGWPDNHLRNMAKDSDGNLWVTTQFGGIARFDGTNSSVYSSSNSGLPTDQYCTSIAIDNENNKWIGSLMFLNKFDGEEWQSWTTPLSAIAAYWFIYDLKFDRNGVLWLGGSSPEWKFAQFTGTEIQAFPEITASVHAIEFDGENNQWLATANGLVKYDGRTFTSYNTANSAIPGNCIYDVKSDASGNLWLAIGKYLVRFDGENFTSYETPLLEEADPTNQDFVLCLNVDSKGAIWLGTKKSGLFKFTQEKFTQALKVTDVATGIKATENKKPEISLRNTGSGISLHLSLTKKATVSLSVFDLGGRRVSSWLNGQILSSGDYRYDTDLPLGVFLVQSVVNGKVNVTKAVVWDK